MTTETATMTTETKTATEIATARYGEVLYKIMKTYSIVYHNLSYFNYWHYRTTSSGSSCKGILKLEIPALELNRNLKSLIQVMGIKLRLKFPMHLPVYSFDKRETIRFIKSGDVYKYKKGFNSREVQKGEIKNIRELLYVIIIDINRLVLEINCAINMLPILNMDSHPIFEVLINYYNKRLMNCKSISIRAKCAINLIGLIDTVPDVSNV
jgi:hypothetical protein